MMRVAIVHDWLVTYSGAERVLEQMLNCFPNADLFSIVDFLAPGQRDFLQGKFSETSFVQNLPFSRKHFRGYLPLFARAIEKIDFRGYDLIISSSFCVAKGAKTGPNQLHICMCYSPVRYAWDMQETYLEERGLDTGLRGILARKVLKSLRDWDARNADRVDHYIAISNFIAARIKRYYARDSKVIYPPVNVEDFKLSEDHENFYLTASRHVPYKRVPLIAEAFAAMPERRLVIIGDGPDLGRVRTAAAGCDNIEIMGYQPTEVLRSYMSKARAFLFAAVEDFGIVPLEAQACGTPVIAMRDGGAVETIFGLEQDRPTGHFFEKQDVSSITRAVAEFEQNEHQIKGEHCRANAIRYAPERFRQEFYDFVLERWENFNAQAEN